MGKTKESIRRRNNDLVRHRFGTFRSEVPEESLRIARAAAGQCGVSRLAGVTGLDHIGVPVWAAIRPMGLSLTVTQGKGLTDTLAQASALMEAIEFHHAERLLPHGIRRSIRQTVGDPAFARVEALPLRKGGRVDFDRPIRWLKAHDVITGKSQWIPRELIDLDSRQSYDGFFVSSSNGLAAGNSTSEATLHALCEVIERDQTAHWRVAESVDAGSARNRVILDEALPASAKWVVERIKHSGLDVAVWHTSTTVDVPCFACAIADPRGKTLYPQRATGYGCHVSKEVALLRALTEAAQSRLTFIFGSRDDLFVEQYARDISFDAPANRAWLQRIYETPETVAYHDLPDFAQFGSFSSAVKFVLSCFLADGVPNVLAIDLSDGSIGIPVMYVCAPFAECDIAAGNAEPGARLCRLLRPRR